MRWCAVRTTASSPRPSPDTAICAVSATAPRRCWTRIGYRFASVDLSLGVRNLFDTYPDKPSSQTIVDSFNDRSMDFNNNFGTFPWAAASPFGYNGRYLYARAEMRLNK